MERDIGRAREIQRETEKGRDQEADGMVEGG